MWVDGQHDAVGGAKASAGQGGVTGSAGLKEGGGGGGGRGGASRRLG